ncbi:MAG: GDP-L-fucose synthase [Actinomycetota bacterium]|nr:GDP-L-fucose synthase [Actinomycetota bacterium]
MDDFWSDKRILVTGGSGFLGRRLIEKLRARGAREIASPRSNEYDLTQRDQVEKLFANVTPDVVIHLAARVGGIGMNVNRPAELYTTNLLMGTYVIEEARLRSTFKTVLIGTICSYPNQTPVPFKEDALWDGYPEITNAPYGVAKKALLVHAQANRQQFGQKSIYLMPVNLYGPGDKFHPSVSHVIPALIKKCVDAVERGDDVLEVWGTGRATREFLYVDDAAEGIALATEQYDDPAPLNLGSGEEISIADLASLVARLVGFEGELRFDPSKPDGQPRRRLDVTRAKQAFGFEAKVPLEEGLRRTIEWYRAHQDEATTVQVD